MPMYESRRLNRDGRANGTDTMRTTGGGMLGSSARNQNQNQASPPGDAINSADGFDWDALWDMLGNTEANSGFGGGEIDTGNTWGVPAQDQQFQNMLNNLMLNPSVGPVQAGLEGSFDQMLQSMLNPQFQNVGSTDFNQVINQLLHPQLANNMGGQNTGNIASLLAGGAGRTDYMDAFNPTEIGRAHV